jgi:hypothetical protein
MKSNKVVSTEAIDSAATHDRLKSPKRILLVDDEGEISRFDVEVLKRTCRDRVIAQEPRDADGCDPVLANQSMNKYTLATWAAFALIGIGLIGCSRKSDLTGNPPPPKRQQEATSATTPALQSVLMAWQQGDKSASVKRFLETDWSTRPLFSPGSAWSLSEDQFRSLSEAEGRAKSSEITAQIDELKKLALAVAQAGRDAAAQKDLRQATQYFTSLKQCGEALDRPDSSSIVKLTGQGITRMADGELAKLKQ